MFDAHATFSETGINKLFRGQLSVTRELLKSIYQEVGHFN
jgi:hypothetical protein